VVIGEPIVPERQTRFTRARAGYKEKEIEKKKKTAGGSQRESETHKKIRRKFENQRQGDQAYRTSREQNERMTCTLTLSCRKKFTQTRFVAEYL
jgi:hypothetical protein